jgi:CRP/FNR family transcriptional regulator, cyclic AMP receptor protein
MTSTPGLATWIAAHWVEIVGYAAAAAGLYSTYARTMIPLRIASMVANVLFICFGLLRDPPIYQTILVNCVLLPLNFIRLRDMRGMISRVKAASEGEVNFEWLKPYLSAKKFHAGEQLWKKGDLASEAYYIVSGEIELIEIDTVVGAGVLIGEIGLVTPQQQRTLSARCVTDVEVGTISYDEFRMLYFQNPEFGFYLLGLVVNRLQDTAGKASLVARASAEPVGRRASRRKRGRERR